MIVGELEEWIELDGEEEFDHFIRIGSKKGRGARLINNLAKRPILGIVPRIIKRSTNNGIDSGGSNSLLKRVVIKPSQKMPVVPKKSMKANPKVISEEQPLKAERPEKAAQVELTQQPENEEQTIQKAEPKVMLWVAGGVVVLITLTAVGITIKQLSKNQEG
jgi:hypothetical protein